MKAEQVVEKILAEAHQEAEKILSEARSKAQARRQALEKELEAFRQETETLARQAAEDKQARMLAAARMELQKRILAAKRELLEEAYEKARMRINTLPDGPYLELMGRLIRQAVVTGDEEVVVGKNETRISHDFLKQINQKLGSGFQGNLRLAPDRADIDGGFILRRGKVQVNCSTAVLIEQIQEQTEIEVAQKLFAE